MSSGGPQGTAIGMHVACCKCGECWPGHRIIPHVNELHCGVAEKAFFGDQLWSSESMVLGLNLAFWTTPRPQSFLGLTKVLKCGQQVCCWGLNSRPQVPASTFLRMQATRARDVQRHPSNSTSFLDRSLPRQYASIRCGAFIEEDAKSDQSKGVRIKIGREDLQRNNSKYKMRKTPKAGKLKCFGILLLVGQGTRHTSSRFSTAQPLDSDIVMPA